MAWKGGLIGAILRSETAGASKAIFTLPFLYSSIDVATAAY